MGHATHFLERLQRVEPWHAELALALYRDPKLVRELLKRLKIPDEHPRVALALEDGGQGPHLILARDGGFVTCLGRGMKIDGTFCISRATLDSLRDWKEHVAQSLRAWKQDEDVVKMGPDYFLRRLISRAHRLSREEFITLRKLSPIIWSELMLASTNLQLKMSDLRNKILFPAINVPARRAMLIKRDASLLEDYWRWMWAHTHITLLASDWTHELTWDFNTLQDVELTIANDDTHTPTSAADFFLMGRLWTCSRMSSVAQLSMANWMAARMFPIIGDSVKRCLHSYIQKHNFICAPTYINPILAKLCITDGADREPIVNELISLTQVDKVEALQGKLTEDNFHEVTKAHNISNAHFFTGGYLANMLPQHTYISFKNAVLNTDYFIKVFKTFAENFHEEPVLQQMARDGDLSAQECVTLMMHMAPNLTKDYTNIELRQAQEKLFGLVFPAAIIQEHPEDLLLSEARIKQIWPRRIDPDIVLRYVETDLVRPWVQKPTTISRDAPKVGRNDACPCRSGKKYKKCCMKEA